MHFTIQKLYIDIKERSKQLHQENLPVMIYQEVWGYSPSSISFAQGQIVGHTDRCFIYWALCQQLWFSFEFSLQPGRYAEQVFIIPGSKCRLISLRSHCKQTSELESPPGHVGAKVGALSTLLSCFPRQTFLGNEDKKAKGETLSQHHQQQKVELFFI